MRGTVDTGGRYPNRPVDADSRDHKAGLSESDLFDRLGIPVPAGGGCREGLSEAVTRAAGERTRAFEAAGGAAGASLLHEPADWKPSSSQWERPDAWVQREPWVDWRRGRDG